MTVFVSSGAGSNSRLVCSHIRKGKDSVNKYSNLPLFVTRTATFSACRLYRYSLDIVWDKTKPLAAFIGLNPSTADEVQDDPTVRRCRGFAESWGCGGMRMLNAFAFRATLPSVMKAVKEPIGRDNNLAVLIRGCTGPHVACWGIHGKHLGRGEDIRLALSDLKCLGRTKNGSPKHPLYLRGDTKLQAF
jgi:hypothetical protein